MSLREEYLAASGLSDEFNHTSERLLVEATGLESGLTNRIEDIKKHGLPHRKKDENLSMGIPLADAETAAVLLYAPENGRISLDDIRGMDGYKALLAAAAKPEVDVKVVLCEVFKEVRGGFDRSAKAPMPIVYVVPDKPYSASVK